ncbi:Pentatricopeptide repeat-containing protein [Acorus gramineus]|uniref:Pentatricopeptide repeat-containing protein n=1 Tax=Acorus gramineus TaxID=55184 RepID=A0AAV9AEL7_ACOGR|nr:Pentatricopeptide repeat-containing protein [Acorus gramineus]
MRTVDPDSVVLTAALSACSHAGLVREGLRILYGMREAYGVEPTIEHYGCAVDLLGRAGRLSEAFELIARMPMEPDVVLWGSLLVACRVHRNIEMGERVAKEMLKLDPEHAGAHVFLFNVYASAGEWGRAEHVRGSMWDRRVKKPPGSSLIELGGCVHRFVAGDASHPLMVRIEVMMEEINRIVRLRGHSPRTEGVVNFDVEEEEKERNLSWHSEKLALAFGLINTERGAIIRIVKNLRVCEDCHTVMKIVSEAFDRVLVVRDRNRFHHFKDGSCSCKDYW